MSSEPGNERDLALDEAPAREAGPSGEVLLEARGIVKTYDMGDRGLQVLRGVSIEVRKGEILAIQGPSGAGKSTLLHVLGLLDEPDEGEVRWRGENVLAHGPAERARYRNQRIGFVFQFYHLFPDLSALENVCLPIMVRLGTFDYRGQREIIREKAAALLKLVGLEARSTHLPNELSGGERQRVAIARALMGDPEVVLCDEPTGNLDQKTAGEILDLLWKLNRETGRTFVIVTHDLGLAKRAHRSVSVIDGIVAPAGTAVKPRGFAETRFRLRGPARFVGLTTIHPALLLVLLLVVPFFHLAWTYVTNDRFNLATRRGRTGIASMGWFLVPLVGLVWPLVANYAAPAAARRILLANGEPAPGAWGPLLASLGFGVGLYANGFAGHWLVNAIQARGEVDAALAAYLGTATVFALAAVWTQSQLSAFYERMALRGPE